MNAVAEIAKDAAYWTERALEAWAASMRGNDAPDGLPDEACGGIENYTTVDLDNEKAYGKLDAWIAEHTHAVVWSLVPAENAAIHREYLQAVYVFPRGNYADVLARAKVNVRLGLRRRGVWLGE